ncbi:hypothetical protein CALCODRAFT_501723, partial [Calocera cornea HHB12733]
MTEVLPGCEIIGTHRQDCQELAARLTWITERVLDGVPPGAGGNASADEMVEWLRKATSEVETFLMLDETPGTSTSTILSARETVAKLRRNLNKMMLEFAV